MAVKLPKVKFNTKADNMEESMGFKSDFVTALCRKYFENCKRVDEVIQGIWNDPASDLQSKLMAIWVCGSRAQDIRAKEQGMDDKMKGILQMISKELGLPVRMAKVEIPKGKTIADMSGIPASVKTQFKKAKAAGDSGAIVFTTKKRSSK